MPNHLLRCLLNVMLLVALLLSGCAPAQPALTATPGPAPMRTSTLTLTGAPTVSIIPSDMVLIPSGNFQMGCDPEHNDGLNCGGNELPLHTVVRPAWAMARG